MNVSFVCDCKGRIWMNRCYEYDLERRVICWFKTSKWFSKTIERLKCIIARLKGIWFEILF